MGGQDAQQTRNGIREDQEADATRGEEAAKMDRKMNLFHLPLVLRCVPAWTSVFFLLMVFGPWAVARAQSRLPIVAEGKRATALLETKGEDVSGTAFCVDAAGFFVTNAHVADEAANHKMTLLLHPGEANEKTLEARIVRTDKDADLALLKVDGVSGLTALPLGRDEGLLETDAVTAFGYPFGKDLALSEKSAPSITVSVGRITALRRDKDGLQFIQLDASLNPGNSGGPVLDTSGKVIGVVEAGVPGAALNFAIPVHLLTKFLRTPAIVFAPSVLRDTETLKHEFQISVIPFLPNSGPFTVTLTLNARGTSSRSFVARPTGPSSYSVSATPVPPAAGSRRLRLTAEAQGVSLVGEVADQGVDISGRHLRLSEIRIIRQTNGGKVMADLVDGQHITGRMIGLDAVDVAVAGAIQVINFRRYPAVRVTDAVSPPTSVDYQITVKHRADVVAQQFGTLWLGSGLTGMGLSSVSTASGMNTPSLGSAAPLIRNPENGHWYQAIPVSGGLHWQDAKKRAEGMTGQGRQGHLVTLTSATEAQWVVDHFPEAVNASYWLGGFQNQAALDYREPDGGWQWVTGESWLYTRWNLGLYQEPNDAPPGHEDYLSFAGQGNWNDSRNDSDLPGFVVEYE